MRQFPANIRFQLSAGQFVHFPRCARLQNCAAYFAIIDYPPRVCRPFDNLGSNEILGFAC
jgi:hypothetical protein